MHYLSLFDVSSLNSHTQLRMITNKRTDKVHSSHTNLISSQSKEILSHEV